MNTILVCDDDRDIVAGLEHLLTAAGHSVLKAYTGAEALEIIRSGEKTDLVLMDVMMPVMNGHDAVSEIRKITNIPVIMLSAKSEGSDKVRGLEVGADDYVTKPFNSVELLARVKAQLRRYDSLGGKTEKNDPDVLVNGGIRLDDRTKTVEIDGEPVSLTPKEYDILRFFMKNPGLVFSPKEIYASVWENDPYGAENTVTVHIRHLREKIEIVPAEPKYILVSWGRGYKMVDFSEEE